MIHATTLITTAVGTRLVVLSSLLILLVSTHFRGAVST